MKIGDALKEISRETRLDSNIKYKLLGVKWYGKGVFLREEKYGREIKATKLYQVQKGDFIYNRLFAWKSSFAIVPEEFDGCFVSNEFPIFICNKEKVIPEFLLNYILLPQNINSINNLSGGMSGISRKRFKEAEFLKFEFPEIKMEKQRSTWNKIKQISETISEQELESTNQISCVRQLRQVILQEAIEGKLTAKWRKEHPEPVNGENHASKLLEKVKAEKENLIKHSNIKKEKPVTPITDKEKRFILPNEWLWTRLINVSTKIHYGFNASAIQGKKDVRLLRITDIQNNRVVWDSVPSCVYGKNDIKKYLLSKNDIVIARTGGTIGKSFLIKNIPLKSLFASYLIRIVPSTYLNPEFIKFFLESPEYWRQLHNATWGAGQPNVNGTALSNLVLPIPPFVEQEAIVERVNTLMAMIDELEKAVNERKDLSEKLMQAVLREAFDAN